MDEELFPVASPALPGLAAAKTPGDIAALPLVSDMGLQGWRDWFNAATCAALALPPMHTFADSTDAMLAAVHGIGAVLARSRVVQPYLQRRELVRLPGPAVKARFAYYAVHPAHRAPGPAAMLFLDWIKRQAQEPLAPPDAPRPRRAGSAAAEPGLPRVLTRP